MFFKELKRRLVNLGIALNQSVNVIFGGEPDETLSARAHRMRVKEHKHWKWTADAIDTLFFFQKDHCFKAHQEELLRRQLPKDYARY